MHNLLIFRMIQKQTKQQQTKNSEGPIEGPCGAQYNMLEKEFPKYAEIF